MKPITESQKSKSVEYLKKWKKAEAERLLLLSKRHAIDAELKKVDTLQNSIREVFKTIYSDQLVIDLYIEAENSVFHVRRNTGMVRLSIEAIPVYFEDK